ncbi:hypothetical protein L4174_021240 [Photobacterium sp. CCB-ST2H9]|uniref:hypothetical protein n=1 Tax=Photobacterium sp. CCB-ST2H9 TaxID=2912855 RepID=UPI002006AC53|nr:hypothetical protein [Photobacterium sp. CCB-ST2H9]UTM59233.1 hypothetical protein L4174_021240 [Photobacterium sp. CCB-ST2H9]
MSNQTFQTSHGIVTVTPRHFNYLYGDFAIELTLSPPDLSGWSVAVALPESMAEKINQEFVQRWANDAIGKLVVDASTS